MSLRELTAREAKEDFFLSPADLRQLPSRPLGLWGCGNTKLFLASEVRQ